MCFGFGALNFVSSGSCDVKNALREVLSIVEFTFM